MKNIKDSSEDAPTYILFSIRKKLLKVIFFVLPIALPILLAVYLSPKKDLVFQISYQAELLSQNATQLGNIQLKVGDIEVNQASLARIAIKNSGNEPIRASDFEKPLIIKFGGKVLQHLIKSSSPSNLSINMTANEDELVVNPLLLNHGDSFELEVISASTSTPVLVTRIAGVREANVDASGLENLEFEKLVSLFMVLIYFSFIYGMMTQEALAAWLSEHTPFTKNPQAWHALFAGLMVAAISSYLLNDKEPYLSLLMISTTTGGILIGVWRNFKTVWNRSFILQIEMPEKRNNKRDDEDRQGPI